MKSVIVLRYAVFIVIIEVIHRKTVNGTKKNMAIELVTVILVVVGVVVGVVVAVLPVGFDMLNLEMLAD